MSTAIDGVWSARRGALGGEPLHDDILEAMRLSIDGDRYAVGMDEGTIVVDWAASPRALDLAGVSGPNAGRTIAAIFDLTGDELRLCYELESDERPSSFVSSAGTLLLSLTFRREPSS